MNGVVSRLQARSTERHVRAFSLIEVVLALGLISFCLMVLLALLPAALTTAKNTRQQTAAASLAEEISTSIRNAATNSSGNYAPAGLWGANFTWTLGSGTSVSTNGNFTLGGVALATSVESQLKAVVVVTPPATASSSGTALISVAWPQQAQWTTNAVTAIPSWNNAAGSVDSWIIFVPRQ